jgi:hypothetical protein
MVDPAQYPRPLGKADYIVVFTLQNALAQPWREMGKLVIVPSVES